MFLLYLFFAGLCLGAQTWRIDYFGATCGDYFSFQAAVVDSCTPANCSCLLNSGCHLYQCVTLPNATAFPDIPAGYIGYTVFRPNCSTATNVNAATINQCNRWAGQTGTWRYTCNGGTLQYNYWADPGCRGNILDTCIANAPPGQCSPTTRCGTILFASSNCPVAASTTASPTTSPGHGAYLSVSFLLLAALSFVFS